MNNFMTAGTEISGVLVKKEQCLEKIANILSEACLQRGKEGKVNDKMIVDINKLIEDLPNSDKVIVLTYALVNVTANTSNNKGQSENSRVKNTKENYFTNRGFSR